MEKIKAVIMDIDRTLVDGKTQQIPPKTKQALLKVQENWSASIRLSPLLLPVSARILWEAQAISLFFPLPTVWNLFLLPRWLHVWEGQ